MWGRPLAYQEFFAVSLNSWEGTEPVEHATGMFFVALLLAYPQMYPTQELSLPVLGNFFVFVVKLLSDELKSQNYSISPVSYGSIAFNTKVFVILHRFLNPVVQNSIGSTCARFIFSNPERSKQPNTHSRLPNPRSYFCVVYIRKLRSFRP